MDNNNFNNQPNGNMQNNPGMQNMSSNMPNQMGPMGGQPMQPGMGPNMNPNMGPMGPYPQPMMKPPKQPMDPAKKKKIIIIISVISGLLVIGIALAIILPIVLRVDYSGAYKTAKELQPYIKEIYWNSDCKDVEYYIDSVYTTDSTYADYIEGCKKVYSSSVNDLVKKLEDSDGVRRDDAIKTQFAKFKAEYDKLSNSNTDELNYKLDLWKAFHSYEVARSGLSYGDSSDAEFTKTANYLIDSGNDTLKTYGEGWLERQLEVSAAYRAYDNIPYSNYSTRSELKNVYDDKRAEINDWVAANKPDIETVAPLNFESTSAMDDEYNNLYNLIRTTYANNYNYGSNDCTEILGEVYCD